MVIISPASNADSAIKRISFSGGHAYRMGLGLKVRINKDDDGENDRLSFSLSAGDSWHRVGPGM